MESAENDDPGGIPATIVELLGRYSSDMAFVMTDGALTWIAPRLPALVGRQAGDILGTSLDDALHADDREEYARALERVAHGQDAVLVARIRHARGHHVPVEIRLHPHEDERGRHEVVGTVRDITDTLDLRETALRAQEALSTIAARSGDLLFVVDGDGVIVEASTGTVDMLGWLPEEMVGMNLAALIHPDQADALEEYRAAVQDDRARGSMDVRVRTRGGAWRWCRNAGVLLTDPDVPSAAERRVLITFRDVDALHREINYAEREAAHLRVLLDASIDPWMVLSPIRDRTGRIVDFRVDDANQMAADYLNWSRERLVGTRLLDQFPGVAAHGLMPHYIDAVEFDEKVELEDVIYPHPVLGESRRYSVRARALDDTLLLSWRDTTTASLARDELAGAEAHFRGIAMRAGDALVRADDNTVVWASPGAAALGLEPGTEFEEAMAALVAPESQSALRTCGVTMTTPDGYTGRWARTGGKPALVVRARPVKDHADECVVVVIDEDWTEGVAGAASAGT